MNLRNTVIVLSLLLAFAAIPAAVAKPRASEDADKIVLENDHVRVWFQGKKPMLKVFPANATEDENATGAYGYHFMELVEYRDVDGDGIPSNQEIVASLNLNKASAWEVSRNETETGIVLNLTLTAPVRFGKQLDELPTSNVTGDLAENITLPTESTAIVSLVFTIEDGARTIEADGVNVTVPATSIKYDVVVSKWPFVNAEVDRLALDMKVEGELELTDESGVEGAEVLANGTSVGALTWVSNASGNTTVGETVDVPVHAVIASSGEGVSRLVFTYDAPDLASFVHDPTIGTTSTPEAMQESGSSATSDKSPVPGLGVGLLVVAALGAFVLRRRR